MPGDSSSSIDQLVARAILDLELKIKHEMRQNSALVMAKMEKNNQQVEKRLGIIEAKLEAVISRDSGARNVYQQPYSGGRQQYPNSAGGRTSYFARTANLANGHGGPQGRHVTGSGGRMPSMGSPVPGSGQPYGFGDAHQPIGRTPTRVHHHPAQHNKMTLERRQQHRPKQTLGTGGNKAQLGDKLPTTANTFKSVTSTWTTKVGVYTDDDDSGDEEESRSGSEKAYSVVKPSPAQSDAKEHFDDDEEEEKEVEEEGKAGDIAGEGKSKGHVKNGNKNPETAADSADKGELKGDELSEDLDEEDDDEEEEEEDNDNINQKKQQQPLLSTAVGSLEETVKVIIESTTIKKTLQIAQDEEQEEQGNLPITSDAPTDSQVVGGFGRGRRK